MKTLEEWAGNDAVRVNVSEDDCWFAAKSYSTPKSTDNEKTNED